MNNCTHTLTHTLTLENYRQIDGNSHLSEGAIVCISLFVVCAATIVCMSSSSKNYQRPSKRHEGMKSNHPEASRKYSRPS